MWKTHPPRGSLLSRRSQSGATIVEAALVLLFVFLPLLVGIIEFGLLFSKYHDLTNAAREGARFGVAPCPFNASIANECAAGQRPSVPQVQARIQKFLSIVNAQGATVSVDPNYAGNGPVNRINLTYTRVQVSLPYNLMFFNYTVTLRADAVMRNETN